MTDRTATASRIHLEALNEGRDVLGEILAEDYVAHLLAPGSASHSEGLAALVRDVREAFPDITYRVDHAIADGDLVALHVTGHGTHSGPLAGTPATHRQASWSEMHLLRFDGERVAEHWAVVDQLSALQQLGGVRADVPRLVVDSATMTVDIPDTAFAMAVDYPGYLS